MAVVVNLVISLAFGILVGLQWLPRGDGTPPPKPLSQPVAVAIAVLMGAIFVAVIIWALLAGNDGV